MHYPHISKRNWWLIPLFALVALAAGALLTARQKPLYRSATMVVATPSAELKDTADLLRSLETLERRTVVATLARIPATAETRAAASDELQLEESELRGYRVNATVVPNTNIIRIEVEGPHPDTAAAYANAAATVTAREAQRMYRIYTLSRLAEAVPSGSASFPDRRRNYVVSLVIGIFLGIVTALAVDRIPATIHAGVASFADGK